MFQPVCTEGASDQPSRKQGLACAGVLRSNTDFVREAGPVRDIFLAVGQNIIFITQLTHHRNKPEELRA